MSSAKGKPLTKDEVIFLVGLIEETPAIISKATNASNNLLKDEAWLKLTDQFNASVSSVPRTTDQLRLKWENLKKAARKRSTKIRMNNFKTGGGKPEHIPPDDALDRVASILGATCDGFKVPYGGDADMSGGNIIVIGGAEDGNECEGGGSREGSCGPGAATSTVIDVFTNIDSGFDGDVDNINKKVTTTPKPKKFFFNTPSGSVAGKQKRKIIEEDIKARTARNVAMAEYYILKKRKLELEIQKYELEKSNN